MDITDPIFNSYYAEWNPPTDKIPNYIKDLYLSILYCYGVEEDKNITLEISEKIGKV